MAKRFSREELKAAGMSDAQIMNVFALYDKEEKEEQEKKEYVPPVIADMPKKQVAVNTDLVPVNCTQEMPVTTVFDLQTYAKGTLVRFPDFAEGQPFIARVRRPSMLVLAKQGKIPNYLLSSANELFTKGGSGIDSDNENMLSDIYDIIEVICEASLKEPTYQQIKDAGLELSDNQLMAIFNYTQTGAKALEPFNQKP